MTRATALISLGIGLAVGAAVLVAPPTAVAAPPGGAYWHSRSVMTTTHPWRFGSKRNPYSLVQRRVSETWQAPDGRIWSGYRELGTRPESAADKKAWRRDGSPAKWSTSIDGKTVKLSTRPAKGRVKRVRNQNSFGLAGQWLTYDEVQRLPADPDTLKDWLRRAAKAGRAPDGALDGWLINSLPEILHAIPAPKEVRAAAYRALLTMPGARAAGTAEDAEGRSGAVVVIDPGSVPFKLEYLIDTGAMTLLSRVETIPPYSKGGRGETRRESLVKAGWTDTPPAIPAIPTSG